MIIRQVSPGLGRKKFAKEFLKFELPMTLVFVYSLYTKYKNQFWDGSLFLEFSSQGEVLAVYRKYPLFWGRPFDVVYFSWTGQTNEFLGETVAQAANLWHGAAKGVLGLKKTQEHSELRDALNFLGFSHVDQIAPIQIAEEEIIRRSKIKSFDPMKDKRQGILPLFED